MLSQLFTLRGHSSSITCILPLSNTNIISGESTGDLTIWNINTRRSIKTWSAHTDSILTILELSNGDILSHSRDSNIRIWRDSKEVFSMPVNSLNFSNVVLMSNYLITPATIDANNFDVYKLNQVERGYEITRVITNFKAYELVKQTTVTARQDFGIIMKMLVVEDVLYLGFESGDLLGLRIEFDTTPTIITKTSNGTGKLSQSLKQSKTIINKDPKVTLVNHITIHIPNPIISLAYDTQIIAGSTTKKLSLADNTLTLNHPGIQTIIPTSNKLVIGYWNGIIEMYSDNQCIFTKQRTLPQINVLQSNQGNTQQEIQPLVKLTCMTTTVPPTTTLTSYSSRFKSKLSQKQLLFVGYEDGTIYVYSID
ncbi:ASTRA-associated protein 1 [Spathaspora sp. JA1]|nr:ASTRA-associated protein 1 [Spathaspora sp. JA1]